MVIEEQNGALKIQEILARASEDIKSTEVHKEIPIDTDLGNLAAFDVNSIPESKRMLSEDYLKSITRDCTQHIINQAYSCPREVIDNIQYAKLPKCSTRLPREKPVPKDKPLTKWEQYAKEKGIKKRKKENKVWDDVAQDFVPRYGKLKVQIDKEKNWVMEVPRQADPFEDQFAKAAEKKKERIAKNEFQRLRNIARTTKSKTPGTGVLRADTKDVGQLKKAMHFSRFATASIGKFQPKLKNETEISGFKKNTRKISDKPFIGAVREERNNSLKIIQRITKPQVNSESKVIKEIERDMTMKEIAERKAITKTGRRSKLGGRRIKKSGAALASLTEGKMGDKKSRKRYAKMQASKDEEGGGGGGKGKKSAGGKKGKSAFGGAVGRKGGSMGKKGGARGGKKSK